MMDDARGLWAVAGEGLCLSVVTTGVCKGKGRHTCKRMIMGG